jgi:hypothetical protein
VPCGGILLARLTQLFEDLRPLQEAARDITTIRKIGDRTKRIALLAVIIAEDAGAAHVNVLGK